MRTNKIAIDGIPTIIWGEQAEKVYVHVHGKMSCKEYAKDFAEFAYQKGYQTISFDLPEHGERKEENYRCDIWNGMHDLKVISEYAFKNWSNVSLYACSLGAYFSLNTYNDMNFNKCLFQSPILNLEYLIKQMVLWFDVTEERLLEEKEITTPIDTLSWEYYQYVKEHPIEKWSMPTKILYGGKDVMQSINIVKSFAETYKCKLTVSENSEHPFMATEDASIVSKWLEDNM